MSARTPSQTAGPFFSFALCARTQSELALAGPGHGIRIGGRVLDGLDDPVPDALVEIWQADERGTYRPEAGWGRCGTDADGRYSFLTVKPGSVAGEHDRRQAPHLLVMVFARGLLKPVLTRMYFPDETEANATDAVLAAVADPAERATMIALAEDGGYRFDVRLQGQNQTAFFT